MLVPANSGSWQSSTVNELSMGSSAYPDGQLSAASLSALLFSPRCPLPITAYAYLNTTVSSIPSLYYILQQYQPFFTRGAFCVEIIRHPITIHICLRAIPNPATVDGSTPPDSSLFPIRTLVDWSTLPHSAGVGLVIYVIDYPSLFPAHQNQADYT